MYGGHVGVGGMGLYGSDWDLRVAALVNIFAISIELLIVNNVFF